MSDENMSEMEQEIIDAEDGTDEDETENLDTEDTDNGQETDEQTEDGTDTDQDSEREDDQPEWAKDYGENPEQAVPEMFKRLQELEDELEGKKGEQPAGNDDRDTDGDIDILDDEKFEQFKKDLDDRMMEKPGETVLEATAVVARRLVEKELPKMIEQKFAPFAQFLAREQKDNAFSYAREAVGKDTYAKELLRDAERIMNSSPERRDKADWNSCIDQALGSKKWRGRLMAGAEQNRRAEKAKSRPKSGPGGRTPSRKKADPNADYVNSIVNAQGE